MIIQTEYSKRELEVPEWYYLDINKPVGPLKLNDLKKLVENGSIFPFTLVCKLGTQSWIDAGSIPGLFILSNTNIPTLPQIPTNFNYNNHQSINNEIEDNPELGCILSIICFWVPIIGIIVFFIEKNEKGRNALLLALAGIVINLLIYSFLI
jgi:hypothetical protein